MEDLIFFLLACEVFLITGIGRGVWDFDLCILLAKQRQRENYLGGMSLLLIFYCSSILPNSKIFNINCFLLCKVLAFNLAVFKSFNCLVLFMVTPHHQKE